MVVDARKMVVAAAEVAICIVVVVESAVAVTFSAELVEACLARR